MADEGRAYRPTRRHGQRRGLGRVARASARRAPGRTPVATVRPATFEGKRAIVSRSVLRDDGEQLVHGNKLLSARFSDYGDAGRGTNPRYTPRNVAGVLRDVLPPVDSPALAGFTAFDVWCGYLLLDAWVAGRDRHDENWGIVCSSTSRWLVPPDVMSDVTRTFVVSLLDNNRRGCSMATELRKRDDVDLATSRRSLVLVWQNPRTRRFTKVGQLDALPGGRFAFHYLPSGRDDADFQALDEYPQRDGVYVSDRVPAFFANRVLSSERRTFDRYLGWLGVEGMDAAHVPFEVLARTGGGRATDTFHVVDVPVDEKDGFSSRFFVSGIRHTPDNDRVLESIGKGSDLLLELEQSNPHNPRAVLVCSVDGRKIGYVPDWLCHDVAARMREGWSVTAVAERVNRDAPAHVRLLCRIDAHRG